jgi:hypothetical protein
MEDTMTNLKTTLLRTAALSMLAFAGLAATTLATGPALAQSCPNNSDFGNRGVCNEAPPQNLPQQPAPDVAQPQQQPAPQAQPGGGGGRNRGNDQGNYGRNNNNDQRNYGQRDYGQRDYGRGYDNYNRGYDRRGYNQSYDYQAPSYPVAPAYPSYGYPQGYGYPAADPYNGGVMSEEQLEVVLGQQGYYRVETVDYATGQYTVDARDSNNRAVRLRVSGQTGQILDARAR